jgi:hypothetical protein
LGLSGAKAQQGGQGDEQGFSRVLHGVDENDLRLF